MPPTAIALPATAPTYAVPQPSRAATAGGVLPTALVQDAAAVQIANLLLTTTAAARLIWERADAEARLIPPPAPNQCYRLRGTIDGDGRLAFFVCRTQLSGECLVAPESLIGTPQSKTFWSWLFGK